MPEPNFTIGGFRFPGEFRIRAGWFGIAILEQKVIYRDGTVRWQRCDSFDGPIEIKGYRS